MDHGGPLESLWRQIGTKADRPPYSALNSHLPQLLISDFPDFLTKSDFTKTYEDKDRPTGFHRNPLRFNERTTLVTLLQGFGMFCHKIGGFAPKCIPARTLPKVEAPNQKSEIMHNFV